MPAPKRRFYSTADIMEILGVSKSKANEIMHLFEVRGKLLRSGRLLRVGIQDFEDWLAESLSSAR